MTRAVVHKKKPDNPQHDDFWIDSEGILRQYNVNNTWIIVGIVRKENLK